MSDREVTMHPPTPSPCATFNVTDAAYLATHITTVPHGLYPGWYHGAWAEGDEILAVTDSAYSSRIVALVRAGSAMSKISR